MPIMQTVYADGRSAWPQAPWLWHVTSSWPAPEVHPRGCTDGSRAETRIPAVQMGGAHRVEASQVWRITMQPLHGLYMHCIPRVPAQAPTGPDVAGRAMPAAASRVGQHC